MTIRTSSGQSDSSTPSPPTYAWIPFGGGIKRCLGASFSLVELTVALQTLLRSGRFEAVHKSQDRQVRRGIVLLPHRGVPVRYYKSQRLSSSIGTV